jgi:hypothetical protein
MDSVEIATTGNASDFGDLTQTFGAGGGNNSSSTRGFISGGYQSPSNGYINDIEKIEIASQGNSISFGDLSQARGYTSNASNSVRSLTAGGNSGSKVNTIDFAIFANGGTATDFGDLNNSIAGPSGGSNAHGGLSDGYQGTRPAPTGNTGRAFVMGGYSAPAAKDEIEMFQISTLGNTTDFGNLSVVISSGSANSSSTRACRAGGFGPGFSPTVNTIESIEIQSQGNAADFGNLAAARGNLDQNGCGSTTRGLFAGGGTGGGGDVDDNQYITFASVGNATDFGNLTAARELPSSCSSSVRALHGGGGSTNVNIIDYDTIASTGDSTDFGDLTAARNRFGSCSSSTRGIWGGGDTGSASDIIDYVTISSTGNATDFGNLLAAQTAPCAASTELRGVFTGGRISPANINVMQYVTIASTGNATDFGDLSEAKEMPSSSSDSHGGLQA